MAFDFDKVIDRTGTLCDKWDYLELYYGEKDMLGLWVADMDFAVPPPVEEAILERAKHPVFGYTEVDDTFYDDIISWYESRQNYHIEKDWILYASGVIPAICYIIQAFSGEGDKIIIQEPVYHPFKNSILANKRVPLINELVFDGQQYKMDLEALEKQIDDRTKLMILCNPHNPTGRVWTKEELYAVGSLCKKKGVMVISDEIHGDLVFPGHKHIPFSTVSEEFADMSIVCNAPTKTFNLAGLQGSNIIIQDPDIRKKFEQYIERFHLQGPTPITIAAQQAAYRYGGPWHDELMVYLKQNADLVADFFAEKLPSVKVIKPEGTYMVWLDFRGTGLSMEQINDRLIHKAKVALNDGYMFGQAGACFQRMNIACPRSIVQQALDRIADAFSA